MTHAFAKMYYREIWDKFIGLYTHIHGSVKVEEVFTKTVSSKYVKHNTELSNLHNHKLNLKVITETISSTSYFSFSKGETFILGSLFMLFQWNETNNNYREENQMTDEELKRLSLSIMEQQEFWVTKKFKNNLHLLNEI
jgi:hypothetical protein